MKLKLQTCKQCGSAFEHKRQKALCSKACEAQFRAQQINKMAQLKKEKAKRFYQCLYCHAALQIDGAWSGKLMGRDKASICNAKKELGIKRADGRAVWARRKVKNGFKFNKKQQKQWFIDNWPSFTDIQWSAIEALRLTLPKEKRYQSYMMVKYWTDGGAEKARQAAKSRYYKKKRDPLYLTKRMMRQQVARICRKVGYRRKGRTHDYFGCSIAEMKQIIEHQFKRGMTWKNYGTAWEIDHVIPLASFNLNDPKQRLLANHWTNLKPEWKQVNREKSDRMIGHLQLGLVPC